MLKLTVGWGFRADADDSAFDSVWRAACMAYPALGTAGNAIGLLALDTRWRTQAGQRLEHWQLRHLPHAAWRLLSAHEVEGVATCAQSAHALQRYGTGSVAEALALQGARQTINPENQGSHIAPKLLVPRVISEDRLATLAVASCLP